MASVHTPDRRGVARPFSTLAWIMMLAWAPATTAQTTSQVHNVDEATPVSTITNVVQRYISATMARDTAYLRTASLPSATLVILRQPASPADTAVIRTLDSFLMSRAADSRRWIGRIWNPTVTMNGNIAVFIAPYDSWTEGRFTHCGIDHYILALSGGQWRVSQLIYTVQTVGCTPSPLGPPT